MRVFSIGVILSILFLLLYRGRYCGFGTNLVEAVFHGEKVYAYDWALKFILTILTLSAGFQGGEVTPLFTIGATLGAVLGNLFGIPVELSAALGYAASFSAAEPIPYWRLFSSAARFLATIICHISLLSAPRPTYSTATARSIPARN